MDDGTSWHPNANLSNVPWRDSEMGKLVKSTLNRDTLPYTIDVNNNKVNNPLLQHQLREKMNRRHSSSSSSSSSNTNYRRDTRKSLVASFYSRLHNTNSNDYIPCHVSLKHQRDPITSNLNCLLDSGALGPSTNLISEDVAKALTKAGAFLKPVSQSVASAFTDISCICKFVVSLIVIITSEVTKKTIRLPIEAFVFKSNIDIILGRETIKQNNLVSHFPSQFTKRKATTDVVDHGEELVDASVESQICGLRQRIVTALQLREIAIIEPQINHLQPDDEWHAPAFDAYDSIMKILKSLM